MTPRLSILLLSLLLLAPATRGEETPAPAKDSASAQELRMARLVAQMNAPVEEDKPFAEQELDDSSWTTVSLPPVSGTPVPWPEGANGTVWYRRAFIPEEGIPTAFRVGDMGIRLSADNPLARIYLNGEHVSTGIGPNGSLFYSPQSRKLQPGTNILAVAVPVRNGLGGIPPGDPDDMALKMNVGINAMGKEGCRYIVKDEWTIPLSGDWKCLFVPASVPLPEGGAK